MDPETQSPLPDLSAEAREWCESCGSKAATVGEAKDDHVVQREIQVRKNSCFYQLKI